MLIGQLSGKTGLTRDTIRFYEKQGLIEVGRKERRFNNYKEYSEETLQRLLVIIRMKRFGFTLNEIAEYLDLLEINSASCENVSKKMIKKIDLIEEKIEELQNIKSLIINGLNSCRPPKNKAENCPLLIAGLH
jgi:DNA-binding transcriptional MerR regulator